MCRRLMIHIPVGAVWCAAAVASATTTQPSSQPATPGAAQVDDLLAQLGSHDWAQREAATAKLQAMGPALYDQLGKAYRAARPFEVRIRIKQVATEIFLVEEFPLENGFLGIRLLAVTGAPDARLHPEKRDARLRPDQMVIKVAWVFPDTGAQRAGLLPEDLILKLNGQPIRRRENLKEVERAFVGRVSRLKLGTTIKLEVMRGNQTGPVKAVLGRMPMRLRVVRDLILKDQVDKAWQAWWARYFEPGRPVATQPAQD